MAEMQAKYNEEKKRKTIILTQGIEKSLELEDFTAAFQDASKDRREQRSFLER